MMDDFYLIAITALLPLTALMLVLQVNPYQALVMRGILGAIAALLYALFGAADVALTEALVGTMLSITLYAVAVRSSMEMRLGWVQPTAETSSKAAESDELVPSEELPSTAPGTSLDEALVTALRKALKPSHMRLEILAYPSLEALEIALNSKRIHSAVLTPAIAQGALGDGSSLLGPYRIHTRVKRLYELLGDRLPPSFAEVDYWDVTAPPTDQSLAAQPLSSLPHSAQESP